MVIFIIFLLGLIIKCMDYFGLVFGMCWEFGIVKMIDVVILKNNEYKVIYGEVFVVMFFNGLGFYSCILYMFVDFFVDKFIECLIGLGVQVKYLNDDVFGWCFDVFYEVDVLLLY